MQTPKARGDLSQVPKRVSPRAVRQLKPAGTDSIPASSSTQASRTPKERSPKVDDRRSPRTPVSEKKRPSRISLLESEISQFQEDLKKAKDQLNLLEACKKQAQKDAEESNKELLVISAKLDQSQQHILELSASEETRVIELHNISEENDQEWQSKLKTSQKEHFIDIAALASALNEIQQLKVQLEMVAESEVSQTKHAQTENTELQSLRGKLAETMSLVENMKIQMKDCKESEDRAKQLVGQTMMQLETVKNTVEGLRSDGMKATKAYNSIASELGQSRPHVNILERLVTKFEVDIDGRSSLTQSPSGACNLEQANVESQTREESNQLEAELYSLKSEVWLLRSALETAETKYHEEQIQSAVKIRSIYEQLDQSKDASSLRVAELEAEIEKTKADIEDLKANLMDKETELQGISEENKELNLKLDKNQSCEREHELAKELKKVKELVAETKAIVMDKETELQNLREENEMLNEETKKKENDVVFVEVEAARAAEREALRKLRVVMEEADKSNKIADRVSEQLEAAQAANYEMEAELKRLKVQSDQWRKAAEAAAAMISTINNDKFMDRTGSMDMYNPATRLISSPYSDVMHNNLPKKKNTTNMLKKIAVLWKKSQK